jgi:hypothetical protein
MAIPVRREETRESEYERNAHGDPFNGRGSDAGSSIGGKNAGGSRHGHTMNRARYGRNDTSPIEKFGMSKSQYLKLRALTKNLA